MKSLFYSFSLVCGFFIAAFVFGNCTDSEQAKLGGYGNSYKVEVISTGQIIRTYTSKGKVMFDRKSDGHYFIDSTTGKLVQISGPVIITQVD